VFAILLKKVSVQIGLHGVNVLGLLGQKQEPEQEPVPLDHLVLQQKLKIAGIVQIAITQIVLAVGIT